MSAVADMVVMLFVDPNLSVSATYTPVVGEAVTVRCIVKSPDRVVDVYEASIHVPTALIDVQVADVEQPIAGDQITIGSSTYTVQGEPVRDAEGLIWTLDVHV